MENNVIVWSKFCLPCIRQEAWSRFEKYCQSKGWLITMCRTTYLPKLHEQATSIWGNENYTMFVQKGGDYYDFDYAMEKIDNGEELFVEKLPEKKIDIKKTKPVKVGKKKGAKSAKNTKN